MRKEDVAHEYWNKDVAPSTELRKWYGHDPGRFEEFARRYRAELESVAGQDALRELRDCVRGTRLTLLTATKNVEHSQAQVLADLLDGS